MFLIGLGTRIIIYCVTRDQAPLTTQLLRASRGEFSRYPRDLESDPVYAMQVAEELMMPGGVYRDTIYLVEWTAFDIATLPDPQP